MSQAPKPYRRYPKTQALHLACQVLGTRDKTHPAFGKVQDGPSIASEFNESMPAWLPEWRACLCGCCSYTDPTVGERNPALP